MPLAPKGQGNAMYNRDEARVASEVYDLYCFLHQHPTMAPNRRKDVLRASVNYTPFGYIFEGLLSVSAADTIDERLAADPRQDPCAGLQRDHFHTWKETSAFFFAQPLMAKVDFWAEMKRRNEIVLLTKAEHSRVGIFQRQEHGYASYELAGISLLRIDRSAIRLSGNKAGLVRESWPTKAARIPARLGSLTK